MQESAPNKPAVLSHTEKAKLEKDGLDVVYDIARFAEQGFSSISPTDFDRLKWLGIYVQRPKTAERFMLRVKVIGGILNAPQVAQLIHISRKYGQELVDLTTRQTVEIHSLRLEDIPEILGLLAQVGLSTLQAAGDCPRNVLASPLDGIDPEEWLDTTQLVRDMEAFFTGNRDFSNLPRKLKMAVSGGLYNSVNAEVQDVSFVPAIRQENGKMHWGFHVLVGGGLSLTPELAKKLDIFVLPEEVVKVAAAVAAIFRDCGYRERRNHARLKFLVNDWGVEKFTQEILHRTGPLARAGQDQSRGWNAGLVLGVHPQKQADFFCWGVVVPAGRLSAAELAEIARVATHYGRGEIRLTNTQNILIPHIPSGCMQELQQEPLFLENERLRRRLIASSVTCVGKDFCPFAVVDSKEQIRRLTEQLDREGVDASVRIHMSGCPNSCGQPQIADIGLHGTFALVGKEVKEGFEIWLAGRLGPGAQFAAKLEGRIPVEQTAGLVTQFLTYYQANRQTGESFFSFVQRVSRQPFQTMLSEALNQDSECVRRS